MTDPPAAGAAGIGTPRCLACPVTAADPARYGTDMSTNAVDTISQSNRMKAMNNPMSVDEFNDRLGDLVGSALLNRVPSFSIASALLRATCAVSSTAGIDIDDLIVDLNDFIAGMNNNSRAHLH